jgi:hypothetical protein
MGYNIPSGNQMRRAGKSIILFDEFPMKALVYRGIFACHV